MSRAATSPWGNVHQSRNGAPATLGHIPVRCPDVTGLATVGVDAMQQSFLSGTALPSGRHQTIGDHRKCLVITAPNGAEAYSHL